jgi:hypothetical protein
MGSIHRPTWFALLVAFVLGGASGFAVRARFEREPRPREMDANVPRGLEDLQRSMSSVQVALEELNRRLDAPANPAVPTREPLRMDTDAAVELADVRELVARLERVCESSAFGTHGLVIPAGRPEPVPSDDDSLTDEHRKRFQLMTYQQVLDVLGRPDTVSTTEYGNTDFVVWSYARDPEHPLSDSFRLDFCDGLVVDVEP